MNAEQRFTEQPRNGRHQHRSHGMHRQFRHGQNQETGRECRDGMHLRQGQQVQDVKEGGCAAHSCAQRQCRHGQRPEAGRNGQRHMHGRCRFIREEGDFLPEPQACDAPAPNSVEA